MESQTFYGTKALFSTWALPETAALREEGGAIVNNKILRGPSVRADRLKLSYYSRKNVRPVEILRNTFSDRAAPHCTASAFGSSFLLSALRLTGTAGSCIDRTA